MFAVFSGPDATVIVAIVGLLGGVIVSAYNARKARTDVQAAAKEFRPNGGSSLRDAVDRLERVLGGVSVEVGRLHERHDTLEGRLTALEDHVTNPKEH